MPGNPSQPDTLDTSPEGPLWVRGKSVLLVARFDRSMEGARSSDLSAKTLPRAPVRNEGTPFTPIDIAEGVDGSASDLPAGEMVRRPGPNARQERRRSVAPACCRQPETGWAPTPVIDVVPHPGRGQHVCAPVPGIES